ncbi:Hemin transport protein hmuS [Yersinia aldovae ATCC 35236]|uniref:Hemin transport protein n=1 Tax=Yersinia aldovae TaxID=29483 RepID=A0A0T9T791_YERAL|nr:hemin-degrading factor [Yersinia aldovae]EEP96539.1 Hemin transport protein hmuS [Yersinia aldovae ATCC 35236]CNK65894.1 hemin transport protein [Yersinia aldovae]CNK75274.1 hemin transport protein [Yersinia aldovae]
MEMSLYQHYLNIRQQHPGKPLHDIALMMNVSEAELLYARVGQDAQRLDISASILLAELEKVGVTKAITCNDYAIHEHLGEYQNLRLHGHLGLVLNPRALDLRLFFRQWGSFFSLCEETPQGTQHSIHCFNLQGKVVHQIYSTADTDLQAWQLLVEKYHCKNNAQLTLQPTDEESTHDKLIDTTAIDNAAIESEWRKMNDIHQFFMLLKRNKITRRQAFRAVSDDLAYQVDNRALRQILHAAQTGQNEVMIFVGNNGCMQIFTGVIEQLIINQETHTHPPQWLSVLNSRFTLHLLENAIAESWVTRKPTQDGFISSLELLDTQGKHILQLFGQRSEGQPEQHQWHQQLAELTAIGSIDE